MRKVVYTFIFGNYDSLKPPAVVTEGWDHICFTDNADLKSAAWDVRHSVRTAADADLDDKRFAMKHMILFDDYLRGYDLSISIGAQMQINCDLDALCAAQFKPESDMMITGHPLRDCIYDEAETCKTHRKDDPKIIDAQMKTYRAAGYPAHNGLYATGLIGRRHGRENLNAMCKVWFDEYRRGSKRDQLSLNYALWRSPPLQISVVHWDEIFESGRFLCSPHRWQTETVPSPLKS